jgi:hypothetical protein
MRQEGILVQTHSTDQLLAWPIPQLPLERRGQGDWVARLFGLPKAREP